MSILELQIRSLPVLEQAQEERIPPAVVTPIPSGKADPSAEFILNAAEGLRAGLSNHCGMYSARLYVTMQERRDRRIYA